MRLYDLEEAGCDDASGPAVRGRDAFGIRVGRNVYPYPVGARSTGAVVPGAVDYLPVPEAVGCLSVVIVAAGATIYPAGARVRLGGRGSPHCGSATEGGQPRAGKGPW